MMTVNKNKFIIIFNLRMKWTKVRIMKSNAVGIFICVVSWYDGSLVENMRLQRQCQSNQV